jgi:hypothetical protein
MLLCWVGATTFSTMTISITTFSITTLSTKGLFATLSINDIQHTNISVILLSVEIYSFMYWMSLCWVSWCLLSYAKLNAVMLSVIMLSVVAPFTGIFTWQFQPDKYLRNSLSERSKQNDVYITYIYWGHIRSVLDIVRMCSSHLYSNSDGLKFT